MIEVKIVADSISKNNRRITTFELEYPRFIHAELLTHRLFSRNSSSSRAIPIKKQLEHVRNRTATPEFWGKNIPGMSAKEELSNIEKNHAKLFWSRSRDLACEIAEELEYLGVHKQITNRIIEPYSHIKVVLTATHFANFFNLRCHPDAQPEIRILAEKMKEKYKNSEPKILNNDEWHMPYYEEGFWSRSSKDSLENALKISSSCCAQVSYRSLDSSIEKAEKIYDKLVNSKPVHASPFEHQAKPMENEKIDENLPLRNLLDSLEEGVTHIDKNGFLWSGNFLGWIQHRQLIPDNVIRE